MDEWTCAVPEDTRLETPEGPLRMRVLAKNPRAVLSRAADGTVRFAPLRDVVAAEAPVPVVQVTLAGGRRFRVGRSQVLRVKPDREVPAGELRPGDVLDALFVYPEGYEYRTDDGRTEVSPGGVVVEAVEHDAAAPVYRFRVAGTGCFVLSCGVVAKAAGD